MSTAIGEARPVHLEAQHVASVPARPRRSALPPLAALSPSLVSVSREIRVTERSWPARTAKRSIDILGSAAGIVLLAPVFVIVATLIRLTSKGPAIFVQDRCGIGGKKFRFYKFRTMVEDAEVRKAELAHLNEMKGPVFKIRQDPRITRLGAFLRKSSIDELPQLWNVLKGDMSLVGPRPPIPDEVALYDSRQAQRLSVIPGITGLWQVSGRSELPDFDNWLALDLEYAQRQSLRLDLEILLKTVVVVLTAKGAQ